jgi:hypothetical protein
MTLLRMLLVLLILPIGALVVAAPALPTHAVDPIPETETLPEFNRLVLEALRRYPADGTHGYWWPKDGGYDGASRDVKLWGKVMLRGEAKGRTFCCGLTLEVFLDAWVQWVAANPDAAKSLTPASFAEFRRQWFVTALNGPGPAAALELQKIGRRIEESEVRAGDFVQLWRVNESGHSAIFLGWIRNAEGTVIGMNYWSSQETTNGIGERCEYFDLPETREEEAREGTTIHKPLMVRERVFFARVEPPRQVAPLRTAAP